MEPAEALPADDDPPEPRGMVEHDVRTRRDETATGIDVEVRIADSIRERCPITKQVAMKCVRAAAAYHEFSEGEISVLITDDEEIHRVNRDHLQHDYPTDVISFGYRADSGMIEGDLIVSVDTAKSMADRHDVSHATELQLYLIHGTLHLGGMDDHDADDRLAMRAAEREVLQGLANPEANRLKVDGFAAASDQAT